VDCTAGGTPRRHRAGGTGLHTPSQACWATDPGTGNLRYGAAGLRPAGVPRRGARLWAGGKLLSRPTDRWRAPCSVYSQQRPCHCCSAMEDDYGDLFDCIDSLARDRQGGGGSADPQQAQASAQAWLWRSGQGWAGDAACVRAAFDVLAAGARMGGRAARSSRPCQGLAGAGAAGMGSGTDGTACRASAAGRRWAAAHPGIPGAVRASTAAGAARHGAPASAGGTARRPAAAAANHQLGAPAAAE
jgi:hypothetical protein